MPNSPVNAPRLAAKWRKLAESRCEKTGERLTPARLAAYAELIASGGPLSAYELVALLEKRQDRKIAPLTVYRHLEFLMKVGLVQRQQSAQSYVPCDRPEHAHESQYLLCTSCGRVDEVEFEPMQAAVSEIARQYQFQPLDTVIEVKGLCRDCAKSASSG